MSDIESKIENAVRKFENDLATATSKLQPLLAAPNIDALSAKESEDRAHIPYAISAYALSSIVFAYLRSEGKETDLVMPELSRVKEKMDKLNKDTPQPGNSNNSDGPKGNNTTNNGVDAQQKPSGKHTHFKSKSSVAEKKPIVKDAATIEAHKRKKTRSKLRKQA